MAKKSNLNSFLTSSDYDELIEQNSKNETQYLSYKKIQEELKKREPYIDFETEVLPNLKSEWADIFINNMIFPNGDLKKQIANNIGYSISGVTKAIGYILKTIDNLIIRKKQVASFIEYYGGIEELNDYMQCLSEKEQYILKEVVLSIDPNASHNCKFKYKNYHFNNIRFIVNKLDILKKQKQDYINLLNNNGGEDFLINEFGVTLRDDYFEVFVKYILDYHYVTLPIEDYNYYQFIKTSKKAILKELSNYQNRKKEVDALIESAGGTEKVLKEIYLNLNESYKKIFEERILAYKQTTNEELAKQIGVSSAIISRKESRLRQMLDKLVLENTKNNN